MPHELCRVAQNNFQRKTDSECSLLQQSNLTCELSTEVNSRHVDERHLMAEAAAPLNELYPDEFSRYLELFFKFMPKRPFHIKRSYQTGFICQKGKYKDGSGEYDRSCYNGLVAKMLDLGRWNHLNPAKKEEENFWIALREPKKTRLSRIDFDNKQNCIGYYSPGKLGKHSLRPVPMFTLEHFQAIKRIYDAFPNRIWCVSSTTMGLHIWEKLSNLQSLETLHRHKTNLPDSVGLGKGDGEKLAEIGLGGTEIHPMIGRACRMPFGQDYYTITADGLLDDWTEQLAYFEACEEAPPFDIIYQSLRSLLTNEWQT